MGREGRSVGPLLPPNPLPQSSSRPPSLPLLHPPSPPHLPRPSCQPPPRTSPPLPHPLSPQGCLVPSAAAAAGRGLRLTINFPGRCRSLHTCGAVRRCQGGQRPRGWYVRNNTTPRICESPRSQDQPLTGTGMSLSDASPQPGRGGLTLPRLTPPRPGTLHVRPVGEVAGCKLGDPHSELRGSGWLGATGQLSLGTRAPLESQFQS